MFLLHGLFVLMQNTPKRQRIYDIVRVRVKNVNVMVFAPENTNIISVLSFCVLQNNLVKMTERLYFRIRIKLIFC